MTPTNTVTGRQAKKLYKFFGSHSRVDVIAKFLEDPSQKYYVRELCRILGKEINAIRRELINLTAIGVLRREERGRLVYFYLNTSSPFVEPLNAIFQELLQEKIK